MEPVNPASSPDKPRIGITIGDPSGIGPEIVLKAVANEEVRAICLPVIAGDAVELTRQARELGLASDFPILQESDLDLSGFDGPVILDTNCISEPAKWGNLSAASGPQVPAA